MDVGILVETPGREADGSTTTVAVPSTTAIAVPSTSTISGSHVYGDDGPYTVTVCVTDDDGATTCDSFQVTVNNVAPVFDNTTFLATAITFTSGGDAFLGRKGVLQTHSVSASDVGSDDLRYDWAFPGIPDRFGGTLPPNPETESTTTFNTSSPQGTLPFTDPATDTQTGAHPHGIFPFFSGDFVDVTFNAPGVYMVQATTTDDNGGTDYQELPKLVTDDCDCVEHQQWWEKQYKERKPKDQKKIDKGELLTDEVLQAYLDIVAFASSRFGEDVALLTIADAHNVFSPPKAPKGGTGSGGGSQNSDGSRSSEGVTGTGSRKKNGSEGGADSASASGTGTNIEKKRQDATQVTLAAWLNFAKGGILWDEEVVVEKGTRSGSGSGSRTGTGGRPRVVMPFNEIIAEVEAILNNPDATKDDIHRAKKLAESINKHDNGNKDCKTKPGTKTGGGTQSGSGAEAGGETGSGNGKSEKKEKKKK